MSHNKPSRLRFAINLGNAVLAHLGETGKPAGITVELSHRLATRWGVSAEFVPYPAAGKVVADAGGEHWDIAFLAIDPAREATCALPRPISPSRAPRWSALIRPARAWPTWIARQPPLTSDKTPHTIYG